MGNETSGSKLTKHDVLLIERDRIYLFNLQTCDYTHVTTMSKSLGNRKTKIPNFVPLCTLDQSCQMSAWLENGSRNSNSKIKIFVLCVVHVAGDLHRTSISTIFVSKLSKIFVTYVPLNGPRSRQVSTASALFSPKNYEDDEEEEDDDEEETKNSWKK